MTVPTPAILVIGAERRDALARELRRYEVDYRIEYADGLAGAIALTRTLQSENVPIALVTARMELSDAAGLVALDCLHAICPASKRMIMIAFEEFRPTLETVREAQLEGRIDAALTIPRGARDEEFHTAVTEMLSDWGWSSDIPVVESVQVVSDAISPLTSQICEFLERLGVPFRVYPPDSEIGRQALASLDPVLDGSTPQYPLVVSPFVPVLMAPNIAQLAAMFTLNPEPEPGHIYDLAVVGAGPAGLAAAVYGASEGLSTIVLDADAVGGQAGSSSMIRNYLGFPRGISGMRLAQRARAQANRFGAHIYSARAVQSVHLATGVTRVHTLSLEAETVQARALLVATGVAYRRHGVRSVEDLVGLGVHYGAATSAARGCEGRDVHIVGGGNSAGQAAVHLSRWARSVTIVIRREDLSVTMSDYLIREITANPRVTVRSCSEVVDAGGAGRLEWITLHDKRTGGEQRVASHGLFLLLGARPCCDWLSDEVARDSAGFVVTGRDTPQEGWRDGVPPESLATTVPGVFAAGDIRAGSMKRVASASGEGAAAIPLVHAYLDLVARSRLVVDPTIAAAATSSKV